MKTKTKQRRFKAYSSNYLRWLSGIRYTMIERYYESAGIGDFYKDVICKSYFDLSTPTISFLCTMVDVFKYNVSACQLHSVLVEFTDEMVLDRL